MDFGAWFWGMIFGHQSTYSHASDTDYKVVCVSAILRRVGLHFIYKIRSYECVPAEVRRRHVISQDLKNQNINQSS